VEEIDSASEHNGMISPSQVPEQLVMLSFCNEVLNKVIHNLSKACGKNGTIHLLLYTPAVSICWLAGMYIEMCS
jgi:hypothetical protein